MQQLRLVFGKFVACRGYVFNHKSSNPLLYKQEVGLSGWRKLERALMPRPSFL